MNSIGSEHFVIELANGYVEPVNKEYDTFKLFNDKHFSPFRLSRKEIDELIDLLQKTKELL
jgi:hypothetical protein